MSDESALHLGDVVIISQPVASNVEHRLSSDGFCDENIATLDPGSGKCDVRSSIFRLVPALEYNALKEYANLRKKLAVETELLRQFQESNKETRSEDVGQALEKSIFLLNNNLAHTRTCVIAEIKENAKKLTQDVGSPVLFGDKVQLEHVKSGKFVTVDTAIPPNVCVRSVGDTQASTIKLKPAYAHIKAGDPVQLDTIVLLNFYKLGDSLCLQAGLTMGPGPVSAASSGQIRFRLTLHSRNPALLNFGDAIRLNYTSTRSMVGASSAPTSESTTVNVQNATDFSALSEAIDKNTGQVKKEVVVGGRLLRTGSKLTPGAYSSSDSTAAILAKLKAPSMDKQPFLASFEWILTGKPPYLKAQEATESEIWSKGFWILESTENKLERGTLDFEKAFYLRNMVTRSYLGIAKTDAKQGGAWSKVCQTQMRSSPDESCKFFFEPLIANPNDMNIASGKVSRLLLKAAAPPRSHLLALQSGACCLGYLTLLVVCAQCRSFWSPRPLL